MEHGWYEYFLVAPQAPFRLFHGVTALLFLIFVPAIWRRLGTPMAAYVLASLLIPLTANELEGLGRYAAVLFPMFILAGTLESRRLQEIIIIASAHLAALARFRGVARGRLQVGYLGGLSIVRFRRDSHTEAPEGVPSALIPKPDGTVGYAAGPTVGLDVRVAVSRRLSVTPGMHATVFRLSEVSGIILRPRVSLRWTF